jgi:energy-coupling factor transport system ATP-binding protein
LPALRSVSLEIAEGQCVVVTGVSGCGKSTLALVLAGYIPHVVEGAMSGEVCVHGRRTEDVALCDLAVSVSLCQQDPESQLCTLMVEDEVRFGPENLALPVAEVLRREEECLAATGCLHLRGRELLNLSGGEKQRVAISSMLAMNPRILILDEPTSNLDPDSAHEVLQAVERLRQFGKITLIIIEHRLNRLLHAADQLIVMAEGAIRFDGRPAEVYPEYAAMLREDYRMTDEPSSPAVGPSVEHSITGL